MCHLGCAIDEVVQLEAICDHTVEYDNPPIQLEVNRDHTIGYHDWSVT